jgi:NADP-dependent 3-hydroxy acid dehydrogenase YdfG
MGADGAGEIVAVGAGVSQSQVITSRSRSLNQIQRQYERTRWQWALVTGASSGFGVEFATLLAERNANLILAARRTEAMDKLAEQLRQRHRVNVVIEGITDCLPI